MEEAEELVVMMMMVMKERAAQGKSLLYRHDSNSLREETICGPQDKRKIMLWRNHLQASGQKKKTFGFFSFLKCSPTDGCINATLWAANHSTGAKANSPGGTSLQKEKVLSNCIPRKHKTVRLH